ncbi:MAG: hypothetical protein ACD_3C00141G0001 [uncultured bacterium (gcode 4)]|uniref:Mannose-1-phosphate guanylyltransferase n=1 Tax=uncultured bacterium (gcode 4) TaxID=1234023 RepID=K2GC94_9BACT|nr:MAG: hypothetical protein ACD_3C00141G0001 [uncultured bacterium (gcode 4)]
MKTYTIIPAWWSGTRLWPLSRKFYPKQFIKLEELGWISLFQRAFKRAMKISSTENILVVTNSEYKFHCVAQIKELEISINDDQIIIEPQAKSTLWAIALWMKHIKEDDSVGLVLWSDQVIEEEDRFAEIIMSNLEMAQKHMVIYWIKPNCPHTWYEYISYNETSSYPTKIDKFVTRPATAELGNEYIKKWYLWNAWIFLFSKKLFFDELKKWNKSYFDIVSSSDETKVMFEKLPEQTIDFWLIQLSDNVYVTPIYNYWTDLWSFDALDDYSKYIGFKNSNIIEIDSRNNTTFSEVKWKKISLIWVDDFIIVDTKDALLISKKGESQKIKEVINILKEERSELADYGLTVYRPWWSYTIIDEGEGFKSKRITVSSNKKLSLQMHYHRSEHWVVVSWTAIVTIWEEEIVVRKWESVFIPAWVKHRLENKGKLPLYLIESQIWDYLEEDDIVRFDDEYWRK